MQKNSSKSSNLLDLTDYYFQGDPLITPKIINGLVRLGVKNPDELDGRNSHKVYYVLHYKNKLTIVCNTDTDAIGKHIKLTRKKIDINNYQELLKKAEEGPVKDLSDTITEEPKIMNENKEVKSRQRWTMDESMKLKQLVEDGVSRKEIAKQLGRTVIQVNNRIDYLKLIKDEDKRPGGRRKSTKPTEAPTLKSDTDHLKKVSVELPTENPIEPIAVLDSTDDQLYDLTKSFMQSYLILGWDGTNEMLVSKCISLAKETLKQLKDA